MPHCPICHSIKESPSRARVALMPKHIHDLAECPDCGVLFFDPMASPDELRAFYSGAYYDFGKNRLEGKGREFARRLNRWRRSGRLLDIGCATGYFISGIRQASSWDVSGVEFGAEAARFAQETLGLDVRQGELADAGFPSGHFDFIHLNNVLEHVTDPVALLSECRRLIKPDGKFYISVPNGLADGRDLIDYYNLTSKPARSKNGHIFFFPGKALRRMFSQSGFEIVSARTYGFKRGLRSLGYMPRKRNWFDDYILKERTEQAAGSFKAGTDKAHSEIYYRFRFAMAEAQRIPGLINLGLDYAFTLRPAPKLIKRDEG